MRTGFIMLKACRRHANISRYLEHTFRLILEAAAELLKNYDLYLEFIEFVRELREAYLESSRRECKKRPSGPAYSDRAHGDGTLLRGRFTTPYSGSPWAWS